MTVTGAQRTYLIPAALFVLAVTGCDQIENVTSGGGSKETNPTQSASGTISGTNESEEEQTEGASADSAAGDSDSTDAGDSNENDIKTFDELLEESGVKEEEEAKQDSGDDGASEESSNPYADRNVEQYPRLPGNVTWKPISASSGDNLTIILWGRGGGEKNYEKGTLRVEYNGGVKYPRKEGPRYDGAPQFLFDVQGGWFKGKDPVLIWNLGAYRIVHPERRQGKNEE